MDKVHLKEARTGHIKASVGLSKKHHPSVTKHPQEVQRALKHTGDAHDGSLLSYNHHNWPRTLLPALAHQCPWGPASLHRARCPGPSSSQHSLRKQQDPSPKHQHPTWSKPTSTHQHSVPMRKTTHAPPAPAAPSPSNHHPLNICRGCFALPTEPEQDNTQAQQLWAPPTRIKELVLRARSHHLHHHVTPRTPLCANTHGDFP